MFKGIQNKSWTPKYKKTLDFFEDEPKTRQKLKLSRYHKKRSADICTVQTVERKLHTHFCSECGAQFGPSSQQAQAHSDSTIGTRDEKKISSVCVPKEPTHIAWLCLIWPGIPHLIHGQTAKGITLMIATFISLIIPIITLGIIVASTIDAFKVGKVLASGKPVAKWAWFPTAG